MSLKIVFMGTPAFAVPSLDALYESEHEIVGVVTATDKLGGRGKKQVLESAVKRYARSKNLTILQPKNLKSEDFLEELKALKADLQVVVAFRMLPEAVWDMPPLGTFNLHASLLPAYRGAAPINWAIIRGEKKTGLTTFFIQHEIDTGDILFQKEVPIKEDDTAGDLHDRMMIEGARLVVQTVDAIEREEYQLQKQDESLASKAPKIFFETCEIDFAQPTSKVYDFIRGLSPYPGAWTQLAGGNRLKIFRAEKEIVEHDNRPGEPVTDDKEYLKFATLDGLIEAKEVQLQGRRRMKIEDFLNGYSFLG